jgi:predicted dehydrogenase
MSFYGYREHDPPHNLDLSPGPNGMDELLWQIKRFHNFLWASGGIFSDYCVHHIDEVCWMKGAWPVKAVAIGARQLRGKIDDQNFDNYNVEYTFADGSKLFHYGRTMGGCPDQFASYAHGSKGLAVISSESHAPAKSRIYKGQKQDNANVLWRAPKDEPDPYQLEWEDLIDAIRNDKPYNEVKRGVEASLVASMGRMAAHTGQIITWDEIMNSTHEFAPGLDQLTMDSVAPIRADANGRYPVPLPGINKHREYA